MFCANLTYAGSTKTWKDKADGKYYVIYNKGRNGWLIYKADRKGNKIRGTGLMNYMK